MTSDELENYFFFSFVRDPWRRFFSAVNHWGLDVSEDSALPILRAKLSEEFSLDHHFETQTFSLFSPVRNGSAVPLHFIGQLENFEEDFHKLLRLISLHSGNSLPLAVRNGSLDLHHMRFNGRTNESLREKVEDLRRSASQELRELYRTVYRQGHLCFGYPLPQPQNQVARADFNVANTSAEVIVTS